MSEHKRKLKERKTNTDLSKAGRWELFRAQSWLHEQSSGFFLCLIYPIKGSTKYKTTAVKNVHFNFHSLFFFNPSTK